MSRNILKPRPPASPNQPPPAPMKMTHQGQPVPIDINLLVMGSTMPRTVKNEEKPRSVGIAQITKLTSHPNSARMNKHVLQTLAKSAGVENSYYDKFERLDRDWVEGDTAYKEKGGRIRSAGKQRSAQSLSRDRKRPKSASDRIARKNRDSFFDVAMSFDDETTLNTKTNAESKSNTKDHTIKSAAMNEVTPSASEHRRRPRSGKKSRDRSVSRKRSERSDSKGSRSIASGSWCSSRPSIADTRQRRPRTRKSRSRTRRNTLRKAQHTDFGRDSKRSSPERNACYVRSISSASKKRIPLVADDLKQRLGIKTSSKESKSKIKSSKKALSEKDDGRKQSASKSRPGSSVKHNHSGVTKTSAIDEVVKANKVKTNLKEMESIDSLMYKEEKRYMGTTSNFPRLKMVVAPTATPLATLVRSSSAKMLMNNVAVKKLV